MEQFIKKTLAEFADTIELYRPNLFDILSSRWPIYNDEYSDDWKFEQTKSYLRDVVVPHKIAVLKAGMLIFSMLEENNIKILKEFRQSGTIAYSRYEWEQKMSIHDLSKFSAAEAWAYAQYDFTNNEGDHTLILRAWHHHIHYNDHHPEYWYLPSKSGDGIMLFMPFEAIVEMVADWIGAGEVYGNPIDKWLPENLPKFFWHQKTASFLCTILELMGFKPSITENSGKIQIIC